MKSTLAASELPANEPISGAQALLVEALRQLDLIEAHGATRARLQGIIDELETQAAG